MVGTNKGKVITATSTGRGCPSTAIAVEELGRCGVTSFIRVGSTGGLQPGIEPGDLVVSHGSLRNDGTSDAYVPRGYPAVPDLELTVELDRVARRLGSEHGFAVHSGINATDDAFYAETPEWIAELSRLGVKNVEMEKLGAVRGRTSARLASRHGLCLLERPRGRARVCTTWSPGSCRTAGATASRSRSRWPSTWNCSRRFASFRGGHRHVPCAPWRRP